MVLPKVHLCGASPLHDRLSFRASSNLLERPRRYDWPSTSSGQSATKQASGHPNMARDSAFVEFLDVELTYGCGPSVSG